LTEISGVSSRAAEKQKGVLGPAFYKQETPSGVTNAQSFLQRLAMQLGAFLSSLRDFLFIRTAVPGLKAWAIF
jgi:hypothetical protein